MSAPRPSTSNCGGGSFWSQAGRLFKVCIFRSATARPRSADDLANSGRVLWISGACRGLILKTIDWIALDWGTSNLRAWGIGAGDCIVAEATSDQGMGRLERAGFEPALLALID